MGQYIIKFPDDLHKRAKLRAVKEDYLEGSYYQGRNRISEEERRLAHGKDQESDRQERRHMAD